MLDAGEAEVVALVSLEKKTQQRDRSTDTTTHGTPATRPWRRCREGKRRDSGAAGSSADGVELEELGASGAEAAATTRHRDASAERRGRWRCGGAPE